MLIVLVRRQVPCHTYTIMITSIYLDHHHTYVHSHVHHHTTLSWSPPYTWITTIPFTGSCSSSYLHYHDHHHIPRWQPHLYTVKFIITLHYDGHHHIAGSPPYLLHDNVHRHIYTIMITTLYQNDHHTYYMFMFIVIPILRWPPP